MRNLNTIIQYLEAISDDEIRERALENFRHIGTNPPDTEVYNLADAIDQAFIWDNTPEGHAYWDDINREARVAEPDLLSRSAFSKHKDKLEI